MTENNIDLFKRALTEGVSNKIDMRISESDEDLVISPAHNRAMNKIIAAAKRRTCSSLKLRRAIAILVAVALLLTGCAVIYRDEIKSFIEEIYETFLGLNYSDKSEDNEEIAYAYRLTYLPEGYELEDSNVLPTKIKYVYKNAEGNTILYEQRVLNSLVFYADIENGYREVIEDICNYEMYYKDTKEQSYYLWNDGEYMFRLYFNMQISTEELKSIIEGME